MAENIQEKVTSLDKDSKVPCYHQIYKKLLEIIQNSNQEENNKIPNELLLCEKFGVSRTTIRNALKELEIKGLIIRERGRGKGTYIRKKSFETHSLQKVSSIVDELRREGIKTEVKVLRKK